MNDTADGSAAAPRDRIEVVGGGTPSASELAAVAVALTPVGGGTAAAPAPPAWVRAALIENVGHRRPTRPSDLDAALRLG